MWFTIRPRWRSAACETGAFDDEAVAADAMEAYEARIAALERETERLFILKVLARKEAIKRRLSGRGYRPAAMLARLHQRQGIFSARRRIDLAVREHSGTPDRPKHFSGSDFDSREAREVAGCRPTAPASPGGP